MQALREVLYLKKKVLKDPVPSHCFTEGNRGPEDGGLHIRGRTYIRSRNEADADPTQGSGCSSEFTWT